jgi:hypothetical protein
LNAEPAACVPDTRPDVEAVKTADTLPMVAMI